MKWKVSSVASMQEMFQYASSFAQDIGATWRGPASENQQTDIFLGAAAFNAKFECDTSVDGPVSSCQKQNDQPSIWRCD